MSHLKKKPATSLVIWLNIVTIVARSLCLLPTHMRENVHATCQYYIVNDGLVNAMPIMLKTLRQFTTLI